MIDGLFNIGISFLAGIASPSAGASLLDKLICHTGSGPHSPSRLQYFVEAGVLIATLSIVAFIYIMAAVIVVGWTWRKIRRQPPTKVAAWRKWTARAIVSLAAIGLLCLAYARFIEPRWIEVTTVKLTSPKLAPDSQPLRIAQISDLHCETWPGNEEQMLKILASLRPDLIVFTGDALNDKNAIDRFRDTMTQLAKIAPTFAVLGNLDMWKGVSNTDFFTDTGVQELNGKGQLVRIGQRSIWIAGVHVGNESLLPQAMKNQPDDVYSVLLYHKPDLIYAAAEFKPDLYLAGHTHGGQVSLPFYGAIITLSKYGKRFEQGLSQVDSTQIYVNRGLGMEGGVAPRIRFCARPEITLFEISPKK